MRKINLKQIKERGEKKIRSAKNLKELEEIFEEFLGEKGALKIILSQLKNWPIKERQKLGKEANELKKYLTKELESKKAKILEKEAQKVENQEWFDVTLPSKKISLGHLHPLTIVKRRVEEIFQSMGFNVVEGPEIENEWYNFDALNIPKDHPARDMWDTFWLNNKTLLRTHTTPVDVRYMEKHNPPFRIIIPGNVYRHEATDASHEFQLMQVDGLMVDRNVSVAHFKAIIREFLEKFFNQKIKTRLRPDFFPFTEPSFDVSISCLVCHGKGCSVCKNSGWLEIAGAGMLHPNVFKNARLNPKNWQGWAFGFGLDRLAMMKYKISDVRLFRSGDLRFLTQF